MRHNLSKNDSAQKTSPGVPDQLSSKLTWHTSAPGVPGQLGRKLIWHTWGGGVPDQLCWKLIWHTWSGSVPDQLCWKLTWHTWSGCVPGQLDMAPWGGFMCWVRFGNLWHISTFPIFRVFGQTYMFWSFVQLLIVPNFWDRKLYFWWVVGWRLIGRW